jgi:hypothetical protein
MQLNNLGAARQFPPGMRSQNSFLDNDMQRTPRGSIHTNIPSEDTDRVTRTSGLSYMGIRPPGGVAGGSAHNKIRVVIRMRPFLEGET